MRMSHLTTAISTLSQSVTPGMTPLPLERDVIIEWPLRESC